MSKQSSEAGFGAIEVLLLLILVAIIGFTGFYVYNANKKTSNDQSTQSVSTSQQTTPAQAKTKYLTITEWGVKIPLTSALSDAYYVYQNGYVYLSTAPYKGTDCAADQTSLGALTRYAPTEKLQNEDGSTDGNPTAEQAASKPDSGLIKAGDHYYDYTHPQAACYGVVGDNSNLDDSAAAKASTLMNDFENATRKITVAN